MGAWKMVVTWVHETISSLEEEIVLKKLFEIYTFLNSSMYSSIQFSLKTPYRESTGVSIIDSVLGILSEVLLRRSP